MESDSAYGNGLGTVRTVVGKKEAIAGKGTRLWKLDF